MEDRVRKIFDLLGVEPNEKFKIKDEYKDDFEDDFEDDLENAIFHIDNNLRLLDEANAKFHELFIQLLLGEYTIVKLPKKKITLEEFWESQEELVIHCNTEEKAKELLIAFHKLGKSWCNGNNYMLTTEYHQYEKKTCYSNKGLVCEVDYYKLYAIRIYEFEEVDLTIKFNLEERAILKNINKKYKYIARDKDNHLYLYERKPYKVEDKRWDCVRAGSLGLKAFNHIFKAIKWEDEEPVEISNIVGDK